MCAASRRASCLARRSLARPRSIAAAGREFPPDHRPASRGDQESGRDECGHLATHHAIEIVGAIADRDVRRAERLVAQHADLLRSEWEKRHARR